MVARVARRSMSRDEAEAATSAVVRRESCSALYEPRLQAVALSQRRDGRSSASREIECHSDAVALVVRVARRSMSRDDRWHVTTPSSSRRARVARRSTSRDTKLKSGRMEAGCSALYEPRRTATLRAETPGHVRRHRRTPARRESCSRVARRSTSRDCHGPRWTLRKLLGALGAETTRRRCRPLRGLRELLGALGTETTAATDPQGPATSAA